MPLALTLTPTPTPTLHPSQQVSHLARKGNADRVAHSTFSIMITVLSPPSPLPFKPCPYPITI